MLAPIRQAAHLCHDIAFGPRVFAYGGLALILLSSQRDASIAALLLWCALAPALMAALRHRGPVAARVLLEVAMVATLTLLAQLPVLLLVAVLVTLVQGYVTLGGWRLGAMALGAGCASACVLLGLGVPAQLQIEPLEALLCVLLPVLFALLMSELAWRQSGRLREVRGHLAAQADSQRALAVRLARYLPPAVHQGAFDGGAVPTRARRAWLTVCFGDLAGFTALTDASESEEVVAMLNDFYAEMAQAALQHGGTLDKFIGDAVMVFFGDPVSAGRHRDADQAVAMAADMRRRFGRLRGRWQAAGITGALDLRLGLHSGWCTVGHFGHDARMEYTVIGATVNAASRLETAAQPGQILLSRATWLLLGDAAGACRRVPAVQAKGFSVPIEAFELPAELPREPLVLGCDGLSLRVEPACLDPGDARALLAEVSGWLEARSNADASDQLTP